MRAALIAALLFVLGFAAAANGSWIRFVVGSLMALVALVWLREELHRDPGRRRP